MQNLRYLKKVRDMIIDARSAMIESRQYRQWYDDLADIEKATVDYSCGYQSRSLRIAEQLEWRYYAPSKTK